MRLGRFKGRDRGCVFFVRVCYLIGLVLVLVRILSKGCLEYRRGG